MQTNYVKVVLLMIWHMLIVKIHEIAINPKYDAYQRGLGSMMYKFVDKKIG